MAESQTVVILRNKRDAIAAAIESYERELEKAKADFAHVTATLAIFDAGDRPGSQRPYTHLARAFRYGELATLCCTALAEGPLSTPDLTKRIMAEKGLDTANRVLARSVGFSVLQSLRGMSRRRMVEKLTRSRGRCVWTLPTVSAA
jgi:hypothetical protein